MGYGGLTFQLIFVFVGTLFLLHRYGNWRKQHVFVTISTFIGWYFSFLIVLLLPLDIAIVCSSDNIIINILITLIFRRFTKNVDWKKKR